MKVSFKALGVLLLVYPGAAHAVCVPGTDYSVKAEYARSTYVIVARAVKETWLDDSPQRRPTKLHGPLTFGVMPGGFDPYSGARYDVEVTTAYKGKPPRLLSIFSENADNRTPLKVGEDYLLFVYRVHGVSPGDYEHNGDLMVDACGNYRLLRDATPVLKQLAALK